MKSIEIREINDVLDGEGDDKGRATVGGRFVVHHMIWSTRVINEDGSFGESELAGPRGRPQCRRLREKAYATLRPDYFVDDLVSLVKASEQVPLTMQLITELIDKIGLAP